MIKAIVFDFNGIFAGPNEEKIIQKVCRKYGQSRIVAMLRFGLGLKRFEEGKIGAKEFWHNVFPETGIDEVLQIAKAEYLSEDLNQGYGALVAKLSKKYAVYCLSNSNRLQADCFRKKGFYSIFAKAFLSHEMGSIKPFPSAYRKMLSETGLKASECIFIDDALKNILGAKRLGFKVILLAGGIGLEKEIGKVIAKEKN